MCKICRVDRFTCILHIAQFAYTCRRGRGRGRRRGRGRGSNRRAEDGDREEKRRRGQLVPVDAAAQNQADHEQQIVVSICMHAYIVTCRESDRYMV